MSAVLIAATTFVGLPNDPGGDHRLRVPFFIDHLARLVGRHRFLSSDVSINRFREGGDIPRGFLNCATALYRDGRYESGDDILARGLRAFPEHTELQLAFALSALERGSPSVARERWARALAASPHHPLCAAGFAASLRELNELDTARTTIMEALRRFPEESCVLAEAVRIFMRRHEHREAAEHSTRLIAVPVPHHDWMVYHVDALLKCRRLDEAEAALRETERRWPDSTAMPVLAQGIAEAREDLASLGWHRASEPAGRPIALVDLASRFENIGHNCDFGLTQRYWGAEPLGLFRFTASSIHSLIRAIDTGLEGYGTLQDILLVLDPPTGEYVCTSRQYEDVWHHTFNYAPHVDVRRIPEIQAKKLGYLKKRFLTDLASGEKILVRIADSFENIVTLAEALGRKGPSTLLWVVLADAEHPAGTVERLRDRLIKGYVDWFYENPDVDMVGWTKVCCAALDLVNSSAAQQPHVPFRPPHNPIVQEGWMWTFNGRVSSQRTAERMFAGRPSHRICLATDTALDQAIVATLPVDEPLDERATVTVSAWVFVPRNFTGAGIRITIHRSTIGPLVGADLAKREVWQKVWASTRLHKTCRRAVGELRIVGHEGDVVFVAVWRLEQGLLPNAWDPPATGDAPFRRTDMLSA